MRLLIAEDDPKLLKSLLRIFELNKFVVDGVSNGNDALSYAQTEEYDGLVLDIMMPGMDGITVLQTLRKMNIKTPALFLTARTEVSQRVEGLDAGADDYLPKPFSTAELLARVRAMLRRKDNYVPDLLAYHNVTLNRSTYQLDCGGNIQSLSGSWPSAIWQSFWRNVGRIQTVRSQQYRSAFGICSSPAAWSGCRLQV